jgi:hypothetical protein
MSVYNLYFTSDVIRNDRLTHMVLRTGLIIENRDYNDLEKRKPQDSWFELYITMGNGDENHGMQTKQR